MTTAKTIPLTAFKIYRIKVVAIILMTLGLLIDTAHAQGHRGDHQQGNSNGGNHAQAPGNQNHQPRNMGQGNGDVRSATRRNDQPARVNRPVNNDRVRNNPVPQNSNRDFNRNDHSPRVNNPVPQNNNRDFSRNDRSTPRVSNTANRNDHTPRVNDNFNRRNNDRRSDRRDHDFNRPGFHSSPGGYNNSYNRNHFRPVYNAHNPNWGYSYLPRRNSVFNTLPSSYFSINFGGFGYRYYDGIYYRPYNNIFQVVAPPIGIHINILPEGYRRIYVNDYPYYYFNGTYYDQRDDEYYVVSPPVGAVVESLPDGFQTVVIDGETYYTADGAQYKPVVQDDGEIWYEVIKAN
ncbi:MAG: DUF6515 family protein [Ferruginibacter sp.]